MIAVRKGGKVERRVEEATPIVVRGVDRRPGRRDPDPDL